MGGSPSWPLCKYRHRGWATLAALVGLRWARAIYEKDTYVDRLITYLRKVPKYLDPYSGEVVTAVTGLVSDDSCKAGLGQI